MGVSLSTEDSIGNPVLSAHRRDIQGLRALAVLAVVAYHAHLPVPGGFTGVDVFFVISGFVITGMLIRERAGIGRIRFGRFYARRFKRLIPALALMVAVTTIVAAIVLPPFGAQETTAKTAIGAMLISANAVIAHVTGGYFTTPAAANPLLNTWSLSVEEQFYLVFPAMLAIGWALARNRPRSRWTILIVSLVTAGSLVLAIAGSRGIALPAEGWLLGFYSPLTRAWEFAVGALLALGAARLARLTDRMRTGAGWVGIALILAGLALINGSTPFPGPMTLLPVLGTALLIAAAGAGPLGRLLSSGPAVRIGDWSYSIYLWHWPFITIAVLLVPGIWWVAPLAAAASFAPAIASYRWVEQPIRQMPMPGRSRAWTWAIAIVAVPVAIAVGVGALAQRDAWVTSAVVPALRNFSANYEPHKGWRECLSTGTLDGQASAMVPFGTCRWNPAGTGSPIYLIGDSNAAQFTEAAIGAAERLDSPLILDAAADCPVLDAAISGPTRTPAGDAACDQRVAQVLQALEKATPGTVILANTDMYAWKPAFSIGSTRAELSDDPAAKVTSYAQGLANVIDRLQRAGHRVVVVQPIHRFEGVGQEWNPTLCTIIDFLGTGCRAEVPLTEVDTRQGPIRSAITQLAAERRVPVIDLRERLCINGVCPTTNDGMQLYVDAGHISVPVSQDSVDTFAVAITQAREGLG